MRRMILLLAIAATWITILTSMEASLNRSEQRCRYEGGSGFTCGDGPMAFLKLN